MDLDKNKDNRLFDFVITSSVPDKEGDVVPEDEIEEALDGWLRRGAPMTEAHSNRVIGKGLRWWKADGQYIGRGEVFKESKVADEVWDKVKTKKYGSVSIGGGAFKKTPNDTGGMDLNDLEILEVAVCETGMHQDANILDVNQVAKFVSPFFMKAEIKEVSWGAAEVLKPGAGTHSAKWDRCVKDVKSKGGAVDAYAVCTAALGEESFSKEDDIEFVKKLKTEVNRMSKEDYVTQEQFSKFETKVDDMFQKILKAGKEDEEKPEEAKPKKPEDEEKKKETKKDGGIGVKEINPGNEGGECVLPLTVDEKREELGNEDNKTEEDKIKLTDKMVKKSVTKSRTPTPIVESTEPERHVPASWEIIKGTKKAEDFELDNRYTRMQKELDSRKAFEQEWKAMEKMRGGN